MIKTATLTFLCCLFLCAPGNAQDSLSRKKSQEPIEHFYIANSFDGGIFSSALIKHTSGAPIPVTTDSYGKVRFSWFLNIGLSFNFNFSHHIGAFTGIDIKNIGYIENNSDASTVKHRVYTAGIPVGLKVGNMGRKRGYVFAGGGIDAPFHYKEKKFVVRGQKDLKFNEWFSQRTPTTMPYVFAGFVLNRGLIVKGQYYPGNFMNPGFTKAGAQPYAGTDVQLMMLSLGATFRYGKHKDYVTKQVSELKTM